MADEAIPAATVIILRETAVGAPEVLMVERAPTLAFAAGALVFPGGRVDPGDYDLAERMGLGEDGAFRVAAIRETIEEVGIALAVAPDLPADALAVLRSALVSAVPIADALRRVGANLRPDLLVPFARWRPSHAPKRVFDTRFFLARLPAAAHQARVDASENVRLLWSTAAAVLADADAGRGHLIFPTRRNLERLARFTDHAAAVADARAHPQPMITPWIEDRDGTAWLRIPDGLGYPVTAEPMATVRRG